MEKQFKLRLKRQREYYKKKIYELTQGKCICTDEWLDNFYISKEEFKEFIKLLKNIECDKNTCGKNGGFNCLRCETLDFFKNKIDKLAGDKLK